MNLEKKLNIVIISGGSGGKALISGIKNDPNLDITIITTATDSGGHTGEQRKKHDIIGLGDLRNCMVSLARDSDFDLVKKFNTRENGECFGNNYLLRKFYEVGKNYQAMIDQVSMKLDLLGEVMPSTFDCAHLIAQDKLGDVINKEHIIDAIPDKYIDRVYLNRIVSPNPRAIDAIKNADHIFLSSGSLVTSIRAILSTDGISEEIVESPANISYISNLATNSPEYGTLDYVYDIEKQMRCNGRINTIFENTYFPSDSEIVGAYMGEGKEWVTSKQGIDPRILYRDLAKIDSDNHLIHCCSKLGEVLRKDLFF